MNKKILIFTATYNEAENIRKFIEKILELNVKLDLLVIDDNSPDETWKIVNEYKKENENIIAGALHIIGYNTLFGRYWGSLKDIKYLHFELCYYQAIDWAIRNKIKYVEGGAKGFHKVQRGYLPVQIHSSHFIKNADFKEAVNKFLYKEFEFPILY